MERFTKLLAAVAVAAAIGSAGCAAQPDQAQASTSSADSSRGTEFVPVPLGPGYVPYIRTFDSSYLNSTVKQACGGADYSVWLTVEFGEVTATSMHVNAVLVSYHAPDPSTFIVPTTLDTYSKEGTDVRKADEAFLGRRDGDSHRYEIDKDFPVDGGTALVTEFHTSAGLPSGDSSDFLCEQFAQLAFYPEGTM